MVPNEPSLRRGEHALKPHGVNLSASTRLEVDSGRLACTLTREVGREARVTTN
jgi:hypothetical protein